MQDAYFQEKNTVGNWVNIGYSAPGAGSSYSYESNVFSYEDDASTCSGTTACTWKATPKQKLNECTPSMYWKLTATNSGDNGNGAYTAFTIGDATNGAECKALTASWSNLTGNH